MLFCESPYFCISKRVSLVMWCPVGLCAVCSDVPRCRRLHWTPRNTATTKTRSAVCHSVEPVIEATNIKSYIGYVFLKQVFLSPVFWSRGIGQISGLLACPTDNSSRQQSLCRLSKQLQSACQKSRVFRRREELVGGGGLGIEDV